MRVDSGTGRAKGAETSEIKPELGAAAVIFTGVSSIPAQRRAASTGFPVCREGKRLSGEFVIWGQK